MPYNTTTSNYMDIYKKFYLLKLRSCYACMRVWHVWICVGEFLSIFRWDVQYKLVCLWQSADKHNMWVCNAHLSVIPMLKVLHLFLSHNFAFQTCKPVQPYRLTVSPIMYIITLFRNHMQSTKPSGRARSHLESLVGPSWDLMYKGVLIERQMHSRLDRQKGVYVWFSSLLTCHWKVNSWDFVLVKIELFKTWQQWTCWTFHVHC